MLISFILGIILNLCTALAYVEGEVSGRIVLDSRTKGISCSPIKYIPNSKREAGIKINIKSLKVGKTGKKEDVKIPVLMFRYKDILNFTTIPPLDDYYFSYIYNENRTDFYKGMVDFEKNEFNLKLHDSYQKLDEDKIFNDYITIERSKGNYREAFLPVYESGIYCVYIAPPVDAGIKSLSIPVNYQNSYGYLPVVQYIVYSQAKYFVLIGLALAGYLIHFILGSKMGKDFKNLNSISIISKAVIFYILLPFISIVTADCFVNFIQNNYIPSGKRANIFKMLRLIISWVAFNFSILLRFFILLFSMGYGVIYYHRDSSRNYRKMPPRLMKTALALLFAHALAFSARQFFNLFGNNIEDVMYGQALQQQLQQINPHLEPILLRSIHGILGFVNGVFPIIWISLSVMHYFKTKTAINKFPPIPTDTGGAVEANARIIKSFKQSILIIFVLPIFLFTVFGAFMVYFMVKSNKYQLRTPIDPNARNGLEQAVSEMNILEMSIFDGSTVLQVVWVSYLNVYLTIILLYSIWIRNNNGLIVDGSGGEYSDLPHMEYEDEEQHN